MSTTTMEGPLTHKEQLNGSVMGKQVPTDILTRIKQETPSQGLIEKLKVTPVIAKKLLSLNSGNRPLRKRVVTKYADEMRAGKWKFAGNTLKFSKTQKLLDGQHQLEAVIESDTTQIFNIQCGLPDDTFSVMDSGVGRTSGDTLATAGISNANVTAAAIKAYIYFKTQHTVGAKINVNRVSNIVVAAWLDRSDMKQMVDAVHMAISVYCPKRHLMAQSTWAFLHFLLSKVNKADAEEFLTLLATGEDISRKKNSAIYLLREKLLGLQNKTVIQEGKAMQARVKYVMAAWAHYRNGETVTRLVIDKSPTILQPK